MGSVQQPRPPAPSFPRLSRSGPHRRAWLEGLRAELADDVARHVADWRQNGHDEAWIAETLDREQLGWTLTFRAAYEEGTALAGALQ